MVSQFIRFLGSVRLAVPLLVAIALILMGATVLESQIGSATVQSEIYKSSWFGGLMFLLAMNLGIATFTRFPWRGARKIGFALTHMGLIVIIAGSAAVIHLNTEGLLLARTDGFPRDEIRVEGDILDLMTPDQIHLQSDIFMKTNGSVYPRKVGELSLLGYSDNSSQQTTFTEGASVENLAVQLSLQSDRMGQTLNYWLAQAPLGYQSIDLGPASVELIQVENADELAASLAPPEETLGKFGKLTLTQGRYPQQLDVASAMGQPYPTRQGFTIEIKDFWPDFQLSGDGQPTSASQTLRNPALRLLVSQGDHQETWYLFGNSEFPTIRSSRELNLDSDAIAFHAPRAQNADFFRVISAPDHHLYYATQSSKGFLSGPLQMGDTIEPGWSDFKLTLASVLDQAQIQRTVIPVETPSPTPVPALHVATPDGHDFWLPWGDPISLSSPRGDYLAAYGPKVLQLPFQVVLNDFLVERNEGSESVAMWTSEITLQDETGRSNPRRVWMNHPTWFHGWKLAQASWNPGDLNQSTLQAKREPWWVTALTWTGSMLVVIGIGTMFYGRAIAKQLQSLSPPEAEEDTETVGDQPATA